MPDFNHMRAQLPACCCSAFDSTDTNERRTQDLVDACTYELTLAHEGQDGCITPAEVTEVKRYLKRFGFTWKY